MKYLLFVYCRKNGVSRDSGLHDQCDADSDDKATEDLKKKAQGLLRYYDEVFCTVRQQETEGDYSGKGRLVGKFNLYPDSRRTNQFAIESKGYDYETINR